MSDSGFPGNCSSPIREGQPSLEIWADANLSMGGPRSSRGECFQRAWTKMELSRIPSINLLRKASPSWPPIGCKQRTMWKQISYHGTRWTTGNSCWKSSCSTWFWKHFMWDLCWMLLPPRAQLSFLAAIIERIAFIREPWWLRILRDRCCSEVVGLG